MRNIVMATVIMGMAIPARAASARFTLDESTVPQGDIAILRRVDGSTEPFRARFLGRDYASFLFRKTATIFLGIHYQLKPDRYPVDVEYCTGNATAAVHLDIRVKQRYPELRYTPPKRPAEEQQRIDQEVFENHGAMQSAALGLATVNEFTWPLAPVVITAQFGERRCRDRVRWYFFNCRYHLGTDYRAAFDKYHQSPVPIRAINDGVVLATASHVIDGKIIIVDHGNGIVAEYLHFSRFLAAVGDRVKRGQAIGVAGKTGDTDAVHLHLTIKMNHGETILDPQRFLKRTAHF